MLSSLLHRFRWFLIRTPYRHLAKNLRRLQNRRVVRSRRAAFAGLELDAAQQAAVTSLRDLGYAHADTLVEPALLDAVYLAAQRKVREERLTEGTRRHADKDFWERLLDEDLDEQGRHSSDSPFVQLAIDDRVLQVAAAYLRDAPLLDHVYLLHSSYREGPFKVSQLWHLDYDDTTVLKLFVYLTDCNETEDGPFTFLPADISQKISFSLHSHRADNALGLDDIQQRACAIKGARLSAFLVDTSRCYHMGSRLGAGRERVLYMGAFATFPKFSGGPANRFVVKSPVNERQRIALTNG